MQSHPKRWLASPHRAFRDSLMVMITAWLQGCAVLSPDHETPRHWRSAGIPLPSNEEVRRYRQEPAKAAVEVREGLASTNPYVRRRTAYLLEQLGGAARVYAQTLAMALLQEPDLVTKAYMTRALAVSEERGPELLELLRDSFALETDKVLRAYVAGAIIKLRGLDANQIELQYLLDSLTPAMSWSDQVNDEASTQFWERRWAATYMIGNLGSDAATLVPPLERLNADERTPDWVRAEVHVTLDRILRPGPP